MNGGAGSRNEGAGDPLSFGSGGVLFQRAAARSRWGRPSSVHWTGRHKGGFPLSAPVPFATTPLSAPVVVIDLNDAFQRVRVVPLLHPLNPLDRTRLDRRMREESEP